MVACSYLQEFRGEFDVVEAVLYDLNTSFSSIIFRPCIAIEVVPLVTSMSYLCNVLSPIAGKVEGGVHSLPTDW
jgi:hypothetical protein